MLKVFFIIAPLFLIILASALLQRVKKMDESWSKVLNDYALKIGLPALIFSALSKASFSFSQEAELILLNSAFLLTASLLALVTGKLLRLKPLLFRTIFFCLGFGNVAYLGIPILQQVYGSSVLPTVSLVIAIYLFWKFTLGLGYLDYTRKGRKESVFRDVAVNLISNPIMIAVVLGLTVAAFRIPLPAVILEAIQMIVASVTPTVLVVIGLFIGKSEMGRWQEWVPVFLFSLAILLGLPALFYWSIKGIGFPSSVFLISIAESAMPLAITPFALAEIYDLDKKFIARSVVLSTLLSVFSVPYWISVLNA